MSSSSACESFLEVPLEGYGSYSVHELLGCRDMNGNTLFGQSILGLVTLIVRVVFSRHRNTSISGVRFRCANVGIQHQHESCVDMCRLGAGNGVVPSH